MAIGAGRAGFSHDVLIEWNNFAVETLKINGNPGHLGARIEQVDARMFDYKGLNRSYALISGGPPCQPFSMGGKHRGPLDPRDMFPTAIRAVRELRPLAFMFENVRGLKRKTFQNYLRYIELHLTYPGLVPKKEQSWLEHLEILEIHNRRRASDGLRYDVSIDVLNAANYGVPQSRERVFIVGFRSDLGVEWTFPKHTYTSDALLWSQFGTEDYWDRHRVARKERPSPPANVRKKIDFWRDNFEAPNGMPWRTVRDALTDLPDPEIFPRKSRSFPNHIFVPGARSYPGHTGSPLDRPAKTLKAGDHGVPGGENMLRRPDGSIRYFTVRESARLQGFPDDFTFHGSWTESMRQLGNAVPVTLAQTVANGIRVRLDGDRRNA